MKKRLFLKIGNIVITAILVILILYDLTVIIDLSVLGYILHGRQGVRNRIVYYFPDQKIGEIGDHLPSRPKSGMHSDEPIAVIVEDAVARVEDRYEKFMVFVLLLILSTYFSYQLKRFINRRLKSLDQVKTVE